MSIEPKAFFKGLFDAAVAAADPHAVIQAYLPEPPKGRTVVIGAGKGAAHMAAAFESLWSGPLSGVVVTRYGHTEPTRHIEVLEAAHPTPDAAGLAATERLFETLEDLGPDDLVVALICGGGSALLPAPPKGFGLEDEQVLNRKLLASGMPISGMNTVRKAFSRVKGGRLALAAYPARVHTLVISDIPGDNPAHVASGPTISDAATRADALKLIDQYGIDLPDAMMAHFQSSAADAPSPQDPRLARNTHDVIASARISLEAAARVGSAQGLNVHILSDSIEGESREVGRVFSAIAREVALSNRPFTKPALLLSGGETTVTQRGKGKGGRNGEFLLGFALGVAGLEGVHGFAADSDGIDGSEDNAGAFCDGTTVQRLREAEMDPSLLLADNNSWTAFEAAGDLFVTGPTGTNVNDVRAILVV